MRTWRVVVGLVVVVVCAVPRAALALHRESPGALRITSGNQHFHPTTRSWDRYLGFSSDSDLLGTGAVGRQIYLFNLLNFDCLRGSTRPTTECPIPPRPYLVQITNRPGEPDNASVGQDDNGTVVVSFDAFGTFSGMTGPASTHRQIYQLNLETGDLTTITNDPNGDSVRPSLNKAGGTVVFESTAPLAGRVDLAGIPQVFVYLRHDNIFIQLSDGQAPSLRPMTNIGGGLVAFESTADLLGDKSDTGISQIFIATLDKRKFTSRLSQITNGNASSHHPYISEQDDRVLFDSTATNFFMTPGGPGTKVYEAPANRGDFPQLRQYTSFAIHGDCSFPAFDPFAQHVLMVCTGDPLQNGTSGNRLFVINRDPNPNTDPTHVTFRQITGIGDVSGPVGGSLGGWFASVSIDNDLTGAGVCGHQLHVIDYYPGHWAAATQTGQLPPDTFVSRDSRLGNHSVDFVAGTGIAGTQALLSTAAGLQTIDLPSGQIGVQIGTPDIFGVADISVPSFATVFPPIPVAGVGAICLKTSSDGAGFIDCDGGATGLDLSVWQDHDTDDTNPLCLAEGLFAGSCRETDMSCQGALIGPHERPCSVCTLPAHVCSGPPYAGTACSADTTCEADVTDCADDGRVGICNGPTTTELGGVYSAGSLQVSLPLEISLSRNPGVDGISCTSEDTYAFEHVPAVLHLTTGSSSVQILDRDFVPSAALVSADTGAVFDCTRIQADDLAGARLVGGIELLDVPDIGDMLLSLRIEAKAQPLVVGDCTAVPCMADADCNDNNLCTGVETCVTNHCQAGVPVVCPDPDVCDGVDACDPGTGTCQTGGPPNCDDGNPCTDDSCDASLGCQHANNANLCDDGSLCTTGDVCTAGTCTGTPIAPCSDGDACNGLETCNPATGLCQPGAAVDCNDLNPCTDDSCDAGLGCQHVNNNLPCNDGSLCTTGDACINGACTGTLQPCNDLDACNGVESCDSGTGSCVPGTPVDCDDGDACTTDSCSAVDGCHHVLPPDVAGVACHLDLLGATLAGAPQGALVGKRLPGRLANFLARARVSVDRAGAVGGSIRNGLLRRAAKKLGRFISVVDRSEARGKANPTYADELRTLANQALATLVQVVIP